MQESDGRRELKEMNILKDKPYRGLLCIKCENCGKIYIFRAEDERKGYYCLTCKSYTEFTVPPARMYINHECGSRKKYLTNMRDRLADIPCNKCGAPVTVKWNHKKQLYETVKE